MRHFWAATVPYIGKCGKYSLKVSTNVVFSSARNSVSSDTPPYGAIFNPACAIRGSKKSSKLSIFIFTPSRLACIRVTAFLLTQIKVFEKSPLVEALFWRTISYKKYSILELFHQIYIFLKVSCEVSTFPQHLVNISLFAILSFSF